MLPVTMNPQTPAITGRLVLQFPNNTDEWLLPVPVDDSPERRSEMETEINGWRNNMMKFVFDERRKQAGKIFAQWWNGDVDAQEINTQCPHLRDSLTNVCGAIDVLFNELFPHNDERIVPLDDFFSDALCQSDNIFVWLLIRDFSMAISRHVSFDLASLTPPTPPSPASSSDDDDDQDQDDEPKDAMDIDAPKKSDSNSSSEEEPDDPTDSNYHARNNPPPASTLPLASETTMNNVRPRRERHAPSRYGFDD